MATDRVVLITGASGALGQAVVPAFATAGVRVIAVDRQPPTIERSGVIPMKADVTDEADIRRLVAEAVERAGRIDALVNVVGGFASGRLQDTDPSLWQRMLTLNVTSAFLLCKSVLPHMLGRNSGRIVHVAARAAQEPFSGAAAYIVSKAALVAMIRALSLELDGSGVTVNGILPATMDTPANRRSMPDADPSKWVRVESVAQTALFLASPAAAQINGALIPIG
ncbi:MAG TPA: SDR family NAD(P)-dependent oxidoreductase [Nitrospira sp.]|nr:SDR family NAD(P)-dependent oxidoreductase [Nitrospira sp.]